MISRIRNYVGRGRVSFRLRSSKRRRRAGKRAVVDHRATYRSGPGEEWTYEGDEIRLNGRPVEEFLDPSDVDISEWCFIEDSLTAYRDWAYANKAPRFRKMAFAINGIQHRILKTLRGLYNARTGGITLTWGDGGLLLNNVNVRAILAMYHVRPTEKARLFIEGLKSKLALILCQHDANPQVSRAAAAVQGLYDDVCTSLTRETIDSFRLSAPARHLDQSHG